MISTLKLACVESMKKFSAVASVTRFFVMKVYVEAIEFTGAMGTSESSLEMLLPLVGLRNRCHYFTIN